MSKKMNDAIAEMTRQMVSGIIKLLGQMSVGELAALGRDGKKTRAPRAPRAESEETPSRSKSGSKKDGGKKGGAKSSRADSGKSSGKAPGRPSTKSQPVTAELRKKLKEQIYLELESRGDAWSKMEEVLKKISFKLAPEIARKIMGDLITEGRVRRQGSTRASRYRVTKASGESKGADADAGSETEAADVPSSSPPVLT